MLEPDYDVHPTIEADSDAQSATSDYESVVSDTFSATSSIFDYVFENGHTYHAYQAGKYLLPNDESEQNRLDLQHHIFRLTLGGKICVTELEEPHEILDVGTGTGIWAIDAGDEYPSAKILGVDLSPIQPAWVPPNVHFEIDDVTLPWTFEKDRFDFIHVRTLGGSIKDWPDFLRQALEHLKPGGRIEISEIRTHFQCDDGTLAADSFCLKWERTFHDIAATMGLDFDQMPRMTDWVREAGFQDVQEHERLIPIGTWPKERRMKEIGMYYQVHLLDSGMENYTMALFTRNGWQPEEVQVILARVRSEVLSNKIHSYTKSIFVTATKPRKS